MAEEKVFPNFVINSPQGVDLFPEKAQEKVSAAIADLISTKDSKSKIIGLEGEWGSGKSNVIKLIKNLLAKTHHVYIHDVWSYQEDLQRRTFLESLTADLCKEKEENKHAFIANSQKWKDELKKLTARKKETTTDIIPVLSGGFIFTLLCIALWGFLGDFAGPTFLFGGGELHPRFLVVLLVIGGWLYFSNEKGKLLGFKDIFYLYNEKDTKKVTNETIFEEEPSPERFDKWIIELQKDFPSSQELVVVFDNMDRLPKDKVRQMWALIHTFFSETCFDKIWVIVPYSREQVAKAFDKDNIETDHFIDKTFSIQYQVPPPIISDWIGFFDTIFLEAYGETKSNERNLVRSVFDRLTDKITPRKIIIFINDTVALKKMWGNEIPLRYIALFSIAKKQILNDPTNQLLSKQFLGKATTLFSEDSQLLDFMSALVYNIPIKAAGQIALQQQLRVDLRNSEKQRINDFAQLPYFVSLLDAITADEPDTKGFELVIDSIEESISSNLNQDQMNLIWERLEKNHKKLEVVQQFTEIEKIILSRIADNRKQGFIDFVLGKLDRIEEKEFSGKQYCIVIRDLEGFIQAKHIDNVIVRINPTQPIRKPEVFLDYLIEAKADYLKYRLKVNNEELNSYLLAIKDDSFVNHGELVYLNKDKEYNLQPYLDAIAQKLKTNAITVENLKTPLAVLKAFSGGQPIGAKLPINVLNETLGEINNASSLYPELVAMAISEYYDWTVDVEDQLDAILEQTEINLVSEVSKCIQHYITLGDLISLCNEHQRPLMISVINQVIRHHQGNNIVDIKEMVEQYEDTCTVIEMKRNDFWSFLERWTKQAKESITKSNIKELLPKPEVFFTEDLVPNELTEYLTQCILGYIEGITENDWVVSLKNHNLYETKCLNLVLMRGKLSALPNNALKAYKDILEKEIAEGTFIITNELKDHWNKYYQVIDKLGQLSATLKNVLDKFIRDQDIAVTQFAFFQPMFKDLKLLNKKEGDFCRTILVRVIKDEGILNSMILTDAGFYSTLINKAGDDASNVKDEVEELMQANPEDTNLQSFGNNIGINKEKKDTIVDLKDLNDN